MDNELAEFAAAIERDLARQHAKIFELSNRYRQYLAELSSQELRSHGAPILARHIEDTMDLVPTRESFTEMLVTFYVDDLQTLSHDQLVAKLPDFEFPSP